MSGDNRDQRGGHPMRKTDMRTCNCCPSLPPEERSTSRRRRDRAAKKFQRRADGTD